MSKRKVSVIIPTYNVEEYVDRLIHNLETQTIGIENLDIIFVDDCSTDNTIEQLNKFVDKYPYNVYLYQMTSHKLQGYCRNFGLNWAGGDYIAFLDADDRLAPEALEMAYNKASEYDADVVIFKWKEEGAAGQITGLNMYKEFKTGQDRTNFFVNHRNHVTRACWDKLYKREFIQQYNFKFAEGVWDEESLFTTPVLLTCKNLYILNYILYYYNTNNQESSAHLMTRDNSEHKFDNAITWEHTYQKIRELNLTGCDNLIEWWFTMNYFILTVDFNKRRKYELTKDEIDRLYANLYQLYPKWYENPIIKERGLENEIRRIIRH